ncbi:MAG TPA: LysM domain-containing protein [Bacillota bacterium]|nr:LysM domain-containing protein [Bacillota bacterium]
MQCPPGSFSYTIQAGDNFNQLAQRYNTTVAAILAVNPGINPNMLFIGQTICIPGTPTPPPSTTCPTGTSPYVIRSGDNFYSLAIRFNTTVAAIQAANPGVNPNALVVGQTICIPGVPTPPPPTTCPTGTSPYVIRSGDNFYSLAIRFNTTVAAIQAANPGVNPNALVVGQTICIPGVPTPPPPTTCPTGTSPYVIRSGDNFYSLAIRFNTTIAAIQAANPGVNPNALVVGQTICIPGVPTPPPPTTCPTGTFPYVIRSGDNFYALAVRFNTTVAAIQAANPGVNPNALAIGQTICIPGRPTPPPPSTCPTGTFPYVIRSGDNFYSLAIRFNTTIAAIQAANPGVNPNALAIGQTICIPRT